MTFKSYTPGSLIRVRDRDWIVQPSSDKELVIIKPLGGTDDEITAIYLPLKFDEDKIQSSSFPLPNANDIGDISNAMLLYDAARLSFRNGAGPFRCMAKLSFRPRTYQMVPLIMALRQKIVRLLIADDVGVGKTIEALLILKEMLERKIISRFAVICLPHLCEQWQNELREKFNIEAVIIRSNTQAKLDREIQGDTSVYSYYPFQVISIDYIKSETRRSTFINECPEFVIVDEAHTCACPSGKNNTQQQRHYLISQLAKKQDRHLVLLTATPHSGKQEEFQSLLGLLREEFQYFNIYTTNTKQRRELAKYFVQRTRADVSKWLKEDDMIFPKRDSGELDYDLHNEYAKLFDEVLEFSKELIAGKSEKNSGKKIRYWTALALLRGIMSSPAAGIEMLKNRIKKINITHEEEFINEENPVLDKELQDLDILPSYLISMAENSEGWSKRQNLILKNFAANLESLLGFDKDKKLEAAFIVLEDWLDNNFSPVVFCRYIETAKYVGKYLSDVFKDVNVQVITSESPDDVRKERVELMADSPKRLLICTDCLSEGINLQEYFNAVLHYDLPWNPNRLEQREGRVDRFGQTSHVVKTMLLYSKNNPMDGIIFDVLLNKVREIHRNTGISMPIPEDSQTILDTVMQSTLLSPRRKKEYHDSYIQPELNLVYDEENELTHEKERITKQIQEAANREKHSRSIFAQNAIHAEEIEADLKEMNEAIGTPEDVEKFVVSAVRNIFASQIVPAGKNLKGYILYKTNLPDFLKYTLPDNNKLKISFVSPTPDGFIYIGRNHIFVEQLSQMFLARSLNDTDNHKKQNKVARAAVIKTRMVSIKTVIILFRVRNVIEERSRKNQLIAEEMLLWGYRGIPSENEYLSHQEAKEILVSIKDEDVIGSTTAEERKMFLENELHIIHDMEKNIFNEIAEKRAEHLVEAHERFSKAVGASRYQIVKPVLPMDILGIYIILPDV